MFVKLPTENLEDHKGVGVKDAILNFMKAKGSNDSTIILLRESRSLMVTDLQMSMVTKRTKAEQHEELLDHFFLLQINQSHFNI